MTKTKYMNQVQDLRIVRVRNQKTKQMVELQTVNNPPENEKIK